MNMSASNKNMILVFLGIIVLVAAYFLGVRPMLDEKDKIDKEVATLQARYNELQSKKDRQAEFEEGIKVYNEKFDEKMAEFPATLNQEYTIEFVEGLRQAYDFNARTLSLGKPEQFYILGSSLATAEEGTEGAESTEAPAPETTEPVIDESAFVCYSAAFPIAYQGNYEGIKNVLDYVAGYRYRMTVDTTNIVYDVSNDEYTGDILLTCYSIAGPDRSDDAIDIDVETGVPNIFTNRAGGNGGSGSTTLNKYDANNGADIASKHDLYVMLNPADSDVSAKSIGQDGKSASQVTSSANEEEALKIEFYEKDGKNYVQYTIGENSYEAEITSGEDATIYVASTKRTGADDKSGVKVTISNTMSIPVYVKVDGDDATAPRFNVTSRSGQVKVYK